MNTVRQSLFVSVVERYLLLGLNLASFIILARLLTPAEIGLYSVAAAVIGLAQVLRDFGISSYLIQEQELTEDRIRTSFTITFILAVLLAIILLSTSGLIAAFYKDDRLRDIVAVLSINFLLIPFGSIGLSLLRRNMAFVHILKINITAGVLGFCTSLGLAWLGYGYWALVASSIVTSATTSLLASLTAPGKAIYRPSFKSWRAVTSFSSRISFTHVVVEMSTNINDLVVGRSLGFANLALLSRAQGVMNLLNRDFMRAVRNVALPTFAKTHRDGGNVAHQHAHAAVLITAIAWPFYAFLAFFAEETLRLLFGPQWDAAAPLVPIMCAAGAVIAPSSLTQNLLVGIGRVDLAMRSTLVNQGSRVLILFVCAAWFNSLMGFSVGILVAYAIAQLTFLAAQKAATGNVLPGAGRGLLLSLALTMVAMTLPALFKLGALELGWALRPEVIALTAAGLFAAGWFLGLHLLNHPLCQDPAYRSVVDRLLPWRRRRQPSTPDVDTGSSKDT